MARYPSPCDKCKLKDNCTRYRTCQPWKTRYLYRQAQINAFAERLQKKPPASSIRKRKTIPEGPCGTCQYSETCNRPCSARLNWWDQRMQLLRKKAGL